MQREKGSITVLVLILTMFLCSLGTGLVMLSKTDLQIAVSQRDGMAAQYLAEAGVQYAIVKLKAGDNFASQTGIENYIITSESMGDIPTVGKYKIQVGPDPTVTNPNMRLVMATGIVNQSQRQIIAHITLPTSTNASNTFHVIWND